MGRRVGSAPAPTPRWPRRPLERQGRSEAHHEQGGLRPVPEADDLDLHPARLAFSRLEPLVQDRSREPLLQNAGQQLSRQQQEAAESARRGGGISLPWRA